MFKGTYAPSTLGSYLRGFTFRHVRQLEAASVHWLENVAAATPLLPGLRDWVMVDIDDTVKATYRYAKQGSGYGCKFVADNLARVNRLRPENAHGQVLLRSDSAFYAYQIAAAAERAGA